ncbi:MAG: methyltransferase domain-containing protein [Candidatus Omnitrophota bacterium]
MKEKRIECNLCGSNRYEDVFRSKKDSGEAAGGASDSVCRGDAGTSPVDIERVFKCGTCGLVFARQDRDLRFYANRYAEMVDKEYAEEEPGRRAASVVILKRIEKLKKPGRLLEIGCANGFFLDEARRRGWDVEGVDISKRAALYAKEKLNLKVFRGSLKKAGFSEKQFDAIVMLDVLQYITDPKYALIEARKLLKDSGILYISTPNIASTSSRLLGSWRWGIYKHFLFFFSKGTLEKMLDAGGFKVKQYNPHIRIYSLKYWVKKFKAYNNALFRILDFITRIGDLGLTTLRVNLLDQIEVLSVKARKLDYLVSSMAARKKKAKRKKMKVFVALPAYNAEKTLKRTIDDIPKEVVDTIILVDDKSSDRTIAVAKQLGLQVYAHKKNMGYGANQKTCYREALKGGADIVIMVHPDYQYDPTIIPNLIEPIQRGDADAVFGSRMMKGGALEGGMPLWKHNVNILLTALENVILGTYLTEYHTGFRAYSADLLRTVNFELNSDKFVFDTEIIVQALIHRFRIEEVPIQTRYFDEASKIKLLPSVVYGLGILGTLAKYVLHQKGIYRVKQFE